MIESINGYVLNRVERQLQWADELWTPIGQQRRYALSGSVYVTENARGGRPITLMAELPWCALSGPLVDNLYQWAATAGLRFTVVFDDARILSVIFRRDGNPIDLTPLDPRKEWYTGSLNLLEA